jgi:uncharacterized lipoprotein YddW (UPF0748 family)
MRQRMDIPAGIGYTFAILSLPPETTSPKGAATMLASLLSAVLLILCSVLLLNEQDLRPRANADAADPGGVPPPQREFRGVWVATVDNIDWPSKRGLPADQQKEELLKILDRAAQLKLNAVIFQVRPACDALYASKYEPWSEYLTGQMGRAPDPYYDPLAFAVEEAHKRGLELHAWFNPYRAHHPSGKSPISEDHVSKTHPEIVRQYGRHLWLDPGERETQEHSLNVLMDVVKRYDIDGVHLDDYFYPYRERDESGSLIEFPDEPSWQRYRQSGGTLSREDWRRQNVNTFIQRVYRAVKKEKPWVKFGVSPFGIWRPGNPPQIKGFDPYAELYADARKWLVNGWLDYLVPQLYWPIAQTAQSYPVLLKWWVEQNPQGRHIWPGNYAGRVGDGSKTAWKADEIVKQIEATRRQPGATGNVFFSMKSLMENRGNLADRLISGPYAQPALVPACPWLGKGRPGKPRITENRHAGESGCHLAWEPTGPEKPWLWVVQTRLGGKWVTFIQPARTRTFELQLKGPAGPDDRFAVSAVNRWGNQGPPAIVPLLSSSGG